MTLSETSLSLQCYFICSVILQGLEVPGVRVYRAGPGTEEPRAPKEFLVLEGHRVNRALQDTVNSVTSLLLVPSTSKCHEGTSSRDLKNESNLICSHLLIHAPGLL